jgi:hypothetical protein
MSQKGSFASGNGEDDDEEEMTKSAKRKRKMKSDGQEYGLGYGGQSAPVFKIEDLTGTGGPVDLVNDE